MIVQRTDPKSYPLTLEGKETYQIYYYWCDDGWIYIPKQQLRRKFLTTEVQNQFEMIEQTWTGVLSLIHI